MSGIYYDVVRLTVGALSTDVSVAATTKQDSSRLQGFRILRTDYWMHLKGLTAGEGPVIAGLCGDLTIAEISEVFAADPQRSNDTNLSEQAMRPLWPLEILTDVGETPRIVAQGTVKLGWSFPEGVPMKAFVHNPSADNITTGAVLIMVMKHFGVWLKD